MNVTRDIIDDLLPVYFSGEASADTCQLVEDYFHQDPAFEVQARRSAQVVQALGEAAMIRPDAAAELAALRRARGVLLRQRILMALALTATLNLISLSFSFEIVAGHLRAHWLSLPWQPPTVAALGVASVALWIAYVLTSRRIATRILT
jgi:hypothetical protein